MNTKTLTIMAFQVDHAKTWPPEVLIGRPIAKRHDTVGRDSHCSTSIRHCTQHVCCPVVFFLLGVRPQIRRSSLGRTVFSSTTQLAFPVPYCTPPLHFLPSACTSPLHFPSALPLCPHFHKRWPQAHKNRWPTEGNSHTIQPTNK